MMIINSYRHDHCPVCRGVALEFWDDIDYAPEVTYGSADISLSHRPELWQCRQCRSWFTQNIIASATSRDLYTTGGSDQKWKALPFASSKSTSVLVAVSGSIFAGAAVIDVGCNTGELLDYCKNLGAGPTYGIELSRSSKNRCEAKGHRVVDSLEQVDTQVDIVFAFDLIEHLYDFDGFLSGVADRLKPDGRLIVLTGNNSSFTARRTGARWWYIRYPEHIIFPSRRAWGQLNQFRLIQAIRTYASKGYEAAPWNRVKSCLRLGLKRGNGLPLASGDHHLLILGRR